MSSPVGAEAGRRPDRSIVNWMVLGLVIERPSYAYELARRFDRRFGEIVRVRTPRIYTALNRLEADALIEPTAAPEGTDRQPKLHYRATASGARAYRGWLATQVGEDPQRVELLGRLLSVGDHDPAAILEIVGHYEQACMHELQAMTIPARAPARAGREAAHGLVARLVAEEQRLRLQARIEWIEHVRQEIRLLSEEERSGAR